jgi:hypothetical protein
VSPDKAEDAVETGRIAVVSNENEFASKLLPEGSDLDKSEISVDGCDTSDSRSDVKRIQKTILALPPGTPIAKSSASLRHDMLLPGSSYLLSHSCGVTFLRRLAQRLLTPIEAFLDRAAALGDGDDHHLLAIYFSRARSWPARW